METKDQSPSGDVRLTQLADIGDGDWRDRSNRFMTGASAISLSCTFLERDDVLIARMPDPLGRACLLPGDPKRSVTVVDVAIARADRNVVNPGWLMWALNSADVRSQIECLQSGTTRKRVSRRNLATVILRLPPFDEQSRISASIDKYISNLRSATVLLESAVVRLPLIRRAVLGEVMPDPLPDGWKVLTVEEVGTVELGRQRSPRYHSGPNMKPYLRVANVHEDRIDLSDVKEMDFPPEQLARHELRPGDILLNEGQSPEFVGRPAMYRGELPGVCFTNSLIRFRPFDFVDGEYALLVFLRHLRFGRFQREAQITTNIAHMAAGRFKRVEFPVPPLDEQRAIVFEVRRQLSLLGAFEVALQVALKRSETLRRAILAAGFRGELVAQDPSDEPASELLARIAAERPTPVRRTREKNGA